METTLKKTKSIFSDNEDDIPNNHHSLQQIQEEDEESQTYQQSQPQTQNHKIQTPLVEVDENVRQQYQLDINHENQQILQNDHQIDQQDQDGVMDLDENDSKNVIKVPNETKAKNRISFRMDIPRLNEPKFEGYLLKKSPHILQGWQKRFVSIHSNKFIYYEEIDYQVKKMMGYLDFNVIDIEFRVEIKKGQVRRLILKPKGNKKEFIFKSFDSINKDLIKWKERIDQMIENTKHLNKNQQNFVGEKRFWRFKRITSQQFKEKVDSLDILLFRGFNASARIQRSLTGSVYDHVALLLRYQSGEIVLFEAVGQTGVGLCRWKTFLQKKWYQLYDKLVFRHLELDRSDQLLSDLQKFVKQVYGKKYCLSTSKLFKKNEEDEKHETFFCSELVAACYKKLGLLPNSLSASQYWPGSFSSERNLKLLKGKLGEELLVDFEDQ